MNAMDEPPVDPPVNPAAEPTAEEREDLLLGAPLGRQFLASFVDVDLEGDLFGALGLGEVPGTATFSFPSGGGRPSRVRRRKRREWDQVPPGEVRAAVRAAVERGRWRGLADLTEAEALNELAPVCDGFGFGGGDLALWGLTGVAADELRPVASALARSSAASRWWEPVHRADQRQLVWAEAKVEADRDGSTGVGLAGIEETVRRAMRDERARNDVGLRHRPPKGARDLGATWWSAPDFAENTWTTGARDSIPTIELVSFLDTFTPFEETTGTVGSLTIDEGARVAEIRGPRDWQALVARFPRDVTGTHDGEWRSWADADGPWYLPDWQAAAGHLDGVHVTIGGYLASCGLARPVLDGLTMLTGWMPDATLWLRDVTTGSRRLGRWHGNPQDAADWDDVREGWTPAP